MKTRKKGPVRIAGRLTYRPSEEGFPLPAKFETWAISPDGKRVPQIVAEVTEYAKYTPTPDDFDLEKQFGVKPLPPGSAWQVGSDGSPLKGRSWWWLYAVAAALALVTAGLVVVARRRAARS